MAHEKTAKCIESTACYGHRWPVSGQENLVLLEGVIQIFGLQLGEFSVGNGDLFLTDHGDGSIGQGFNVIHIDKIRAVGPQEIIIGSQLLGELLQTSGVIQSRTVGQMEQQGTSHDLALFQLAQINAGDAVFAAYDQAVLLLLLAIIADGIHEPEESVFGTGLELIEIGIHPVGLQCEIGRGSQEDDFDIAVILAKLCSDADAVFSGHQYVQKQCVKPFALGDRVDQIQRTVEEGALNFQVFLGTISIQQGLQFLQIRGIVIAKS